MDDGLLSLKWNNHKSTFFEILKLLREKASYTDATIAVDGKFYPVHKLVLSTCSEYFSEIFERTPCTSPVIVLKDVRSQDLESLLDYMYLGEVNVNQNDLALLLKTAECLRIKGLAVPDDDPEKHSNLTRKYSTFDEIDNLKDVPSAKRKKEDPSSSSPSRITTTTNVSISPPISSQNNILEPKTLSLDSEDAYIKFEKETEENSYASESNFESELDCNKSEPDVSGLSNFTTAPSQPVNNETWEDGENSLPQDSFDDSSKQQAEDDEELDVTSYPEDGNNTSLIPLSIALIQSREARRCQLCQVTLANANLLRRHVEDHHFHIRKYDCVHCGKKFKRKEHRERHERIHTGEKPFACHICSSRFTQKEHLKGHIENVHNKHREREIYCTTLDNYDTDRDVSSPPSLASPSSLASLISSPLVSLMPSTIPLPASSPPAIMPSMSSSEESGTMTALYAPFSRKSVNSPNKHVHTITINFN